MYLPQQKINKKFIKNLIKAKEKEEMMEDLVESILDYVRSDYTDYAIMINGEWGSRKDTFLES